MKRETRPITTFKQPYGGYFSLPLAAEEGSTLKGFDVACAD
jgi:hypothetical protein